MGTTMFIVVPAGGHQFEYVVGNMSNAEDDHLMFGTGQSWEKKEKGIPDDWLHPLNTLGYNIIKLHAKLNEFFKVIKA